MKNLFDRLNNGKSAKFVRINGYLAKTSGEVANHTINVNISVKNAKETDFQRLKNCTNSDLEMIAKANNLDLATCKLALSEMLTSAEKNLSANVDDHTNQSKGQTDAYIFITPAIRLHKDTLEVHIFGQAIAKVVLVKGEYKQVNSSNKTLAKNAIKKHLDLRSDKFRDFIIPNIESVKLMAKP